MSAAVCFIEMVTVSESGPYGFLMNVVASLTFICPAAFVYRHRRTAGGAILGLALGAAAMTITMMLWNYIITPFYNRTPREVIGAMLVPVILPFNVVKAGLNAAITLVLYQPITNALRRARLLPALPDGSLRRSVHLGILFLGLFLLISCGALVLVLRGVL